MIVLKKVTVCGQTWTETEEVDAETVRRQRQAHRESLARRKDLQANRLRVPNFGRTHLSHETSIPHDEDSHNS